MSSSTTSKALKEDNRLSLPATGALEDDGSSSALRLAPPNHVESTVKEDSSTRSAKRNSAESKKRSSGRKDRDRPNDVGSDGDDEDVDQPGAVAITGGMPTPAEDVSEDDPPQEMVSAQVINEEELEAQILSRKSEELRRRVMGDAVVATKVDTTGSKLKKFGLLAFLVIVIIVIVLAIALSVSRNSDSDKSLISPTDDLPAYLQTLFLPVSGSAAFEDSTSPQSRALDWMLSSDEMLLVEMGDQALIERYVLAVLYYSTTGSEWINPFGFLNTTSSFCEWNELTQEGLRGVECSQKGSITKLQLGQNNLNGTIPEELSAIVELGILAFEENTLEGSIPSKLGSLDRLKELTLRENSLTGTIPDTLTQLTNLEVLKVQRNFLTGTIHSGLTRMPSVEAIFLSFNQLTGTIPDYLPQSNVKRVSFQENFLGGTIPDSYGFQRQMTYLNFGDQPNLTGTIPWAFGALESLEILALDNCSFTGTLATELGLMRNVVEIYIQNNRLSGQLPTELGQLDRLERVWMQNNSFTGTIPSELANFENLVALRLDSNEFEGNVPSEFGALEAISGDGVLNLSFNNLTGSLDSIFCGDNNTPPLFLFADCDEVECSCCTSCCEDSTGECKSELDLICEGTAALFEEYEYELFGTECDCLEDGSRLSCADTQCQFCNADESLCAQSVDYGYIYDERGIDDNYICTIDFVKGREGNLTLQQWFNNFTCQVLVDGMPCNSCEFTSCDSGAEDWALDCSNLEDEWLYNGCDGDLFNGAGPLEAFGKEMFFADCYPCF